MATLVAHWLVRYPDGLYLGQVPRGWSDLLYELIYTSVATRPMDTAGLDELLDVARSRNETLNITGLLIYDEQGFMQLLEGEKADVDAVFASIKKDKRHYDIAVYHRGDIAERAFGDWSMAFRRIDPETGIPALSSALMGGEHKDELPVAANCGSRLLRLLHAAQVR